MFVERRSGFDVPVVDEPDQGVVHLAIISFRMGDEWRGPESTNEVGAPAYSYRNASIGSTRDARIAGTSPADSATTASATVATARTTGS